MYHSKKTRRGVNSFLGSMDLPLKSTQIVNFGGKLSEFADFENTGLDQL